jgi:hypothetical protein
MAEADSAGLAGVEEIADGLLEQVPDAVVIESLADSPSRALEGDPLDVHARRDRVGALRELNERGVRGVLRVVERDRDVEDVLVEIAGSELTARLVGRAPTTRGSSSLSRMASGTRRSRSASLGRSSRRSATPIRSLTLSSASMARSDRYRATARATKTSSFITR